MADEDAQETDERWAQFADAARRGVLWCLSDGDDWMTLRDETTGRGAFPVWGSEQDAKAAATELWDGADPTPIRLEDWTEFLEELERDGDLIALLPAPDGSYVAAEPAEVREELAGLA